jgi:hypothetical protein
VRDLASITKGASVYGSGIRLKFFKYLFPVREDLDNPPKIKDVVASGLLTGTHRHLGRGVYVAHVPPLIRAILCLGLHIKPDFAVVHGGYKGLGKFSNDLLAVGEDVEDSILQVGVSDLTIPNATGSCF